MDKVGALMALILPAIIVIGFWWWTISNAKKTRSRIKVNIGLWVIMTFLAYGGLLWLFSKLFGIE